MREESLLEKVEKAVDQTQETTKEFDAVVDCFYELYELLKNQDQVRLKTTGRTPTKENELAGSISTFAEWHWGGYDRDQRTKNVVSQQLWSEVSEHVRSITGKHLVSLGASAPIPDAK